MPTLEGMQSVHKAKLYWEKGAGKTGTKLKVPDEFSSEPKPLTDVMRKAVSAAEAAMTRSKNHIINEILKLVKTTVGHPDINEFQDPAGSAMGFSFRFRLPDTDEYHILHLRMNVMDFIRDPDYEAEKAISEFTDYWRVFWCGDG